MRVFTSASSQLIFAWQTELMIESLLGKGFREGDINIGITQVHNGVTEEWILLQRKYKSIRFVYFDPNPELDYIGSTKAYGIWQYFKLYPEEIKHQYLFIDQDVILPKRLDSYPANGTMYASRADYLDVDRITEKGDFYLQPMLDCCGIDESKVDKYGGCGAQYIFDNVPVELWRDAYHNAVKLYHLLKGINNEHDRTDATGVNPWTAEMWSTIWEFYKRDIPVSVPKSLEFAWPNFPKETFGDYQFYHDAGNTREFAKEIGKTMFCKYEWISKVPYGEDIPVSDDIAQSIYVKFMQAVGKNSPLLPKKDYLEVEDSNDLLSNKTPLGYMVNSIPLESLVKVLGSVSSIDEESFEGKDTFLPSKTYKHEVPLVIKNELSSQLQKVAEGWVGEELEPTAVYGIREYTKGSRLENHVDRQDTHHVGIVIPLYKDADWPLHLKDHKGNWNKLEVNPGEIIIYEAARCPHGRPDKFIGNSYKALFIHYKYKNI